VRSPTRAGRTSLVHADTHEEAAPALLRVLRGTVLARPGSSAPFDSADFEAIGTAGRPVIVHVAAAAIDPIAVSGSTQPTDFLLTEQASLQGDAQLFRSTITGGTITAAPRPRLRCFPAACRIHVKWPRHT